ncbi:MAG TPA: type II toxin-antitoxin system death-on-curing family toxin [Caulobacteraceae bacterium]|nr:type II toxin-antitoxin system death-on-curing family toxin [Caulobacteraceae bacterium]
MTPLKEPRWITKHGLLLLHDRSLALHGGAEGMRDEGLLDSALMRPRNLFHYELVDDLPALAATYAGAIAANHPFVDGNKRAAFLAAGMFLEKNGQRLEAEQADAALTILALAAGRLEVPQLIDWIRANCRAA